jgi:hypothetical protein
MTNSIIILGVLACGSLATALSHQTGGDRQGLLPA